MKYFLDTEFHEYKKKPLFGKAVDTIELISIGIIAEDGREYYAISKDFDVKAVWNNEWLRNNILKPLFYELMNKDIHFHNIDNLFTNSKLKDLILKYGKTNKKIAEEIIDFCKEGNRNYYNISSEDHNAVRIVEDGGEVYMKTIYCSAPEFYGYYSDYDWVVFCWLFGRMIDLPKGFPMYCIDLKQELERLNETLGYNSDHKGNEYKIQRHPSYPKQTNEHNALADAKWNYELYKFLQRL